MTRPGIWSPVKSEPERWACQGCGANGEGRGDRPGQWTGTRKCPRCGKGKVMTNRCRHGGTPLCTVYGFGRHATVADAIRCEARR